MHITQPSPIENITIDSIEQILSYCPVNCLGTISLVSKQFYKASQNARDLTLPVYNFIHTVFPKHKALLPILVKKSDAKPVFDKLWLVIKEIIEKKEYSCEKENTLLSYQNNILDNNTEKVNLYTKELLLNIMSSHIEITRSHASASYKPYIDLTIRQIPEFPFLKDTFKNLNCNVTINIWQRERIEINNKQIEFIIDAAKSLNHVPKEYFCFFDVRLESFTDSQIDNIWQHIPIDRLETIWFPYYKKDSLKNLQLKDVNRRFINVIDYGNHFYAKNNQYTK